MKIYYKMLVTSQEIQMKDISLYEWVKSLRRKATNILIESKIGKKSIVLKGMSRQIP